MKIVAFAGGVGGAKLVAGLAEVLDPSELLVIVNTADDFSHYGLTICPDLDTICYTLAGIVNRKTGWGRSRDTFHLLNTLGQLGGITWFQLGDRDLALHLERTRLVRDGYALSQITAIFCQRLGIRHSVLPMSDDPIHTMVNTVENKILPFQEYFVEKHFSPQVRGFIFDGIESATPAPGILDAILNADGIIIAPSNPWVSIDPILGVPGILKAIIKKKVVAISPLISGSAIKGPAAKMFSELGIPPSCVSVFQHYSHFLKGILIDSRDKNSSSLIPIPVLCTNILMSSHKDRIRLALNVLNFMNTL